MTTERELTMRIAVLEQKVAELYRLIDAKEPGGEPGAEGSGAFATEAEEDPRLQVLAREGRTIEAIKIYRELTGAGIKEAKSAVERLEQLHRPSG